MEIYRKRNVYIKQEENLGTKRVYDIWTLKEFVSFVI